MTENRLRGVFAAVLTPMNDDLSCDTDLLGRHCLRLLDEGCEGVSLFGTTGEGPALSVDERPRRPRSRARRRGCRPGGSSPAPAAPRRPTP